MSIGHPLHFALALAIAALFAVAIAWIARNRHGGEVTFSNVVFVVEAVRPNAWIERGIFVAVVAGLVAIATAVSGPHARVPVLVRDGAVYVCIDTSGSMASNDVLPTRAQAAQAAARAFVAAAPTQTRIGLIAFSTGAAVVQPLTTDREQIGAAIAALPPPNGATAIGDALALAGQGLPARGHRVVIVITDGVNNRGFDPLAQARALGARGIRIYTVGIGTSAGGLIPGTDQVATLDEDALRAYAQAGRGTYARAGSASALRDALARLGRSSSFEPKTVDASFAFALAGGLVIFGAALTGFAIGRVP